MAISIAGQFRYDVVLARQPSGGWGGQAASGEHDSPHPGLAGHRPHVLLSDGLITLRRTESVFKALGRPYREWGLPASRVSFPVGRVLEAMLEPGDLLRVSRGATTDLSATLVRGDELLVGLGALVGSPLDGNITLQEDPRAHEAHLYHLADRIAEPETAFAWLDAADPQVESAIDNLLNLRGTHLVVAIAGPTEEARRQLNHRVAKFPMGRSGHRSRAYVDVPSRFTTAEQWLDYLRRLPTTRPDDLYIRFNVGTDAIDVREGEYAYRTPWHLSVARVFTYGVPGEWSIVGMARDHPVVTGEMLLEATQLLASRRIAIED